MNKKPELLAPAGNMECLKTAFYFGADAAYLSGMAFGLRAFAANFSKEQIAEAIRYAHILNKKIYIACNSVIRNDELSELKNFLKFLEDIKADAVILSDPAVLQIIKTEKLNLPMHLSTQVNTLNTAACEFWHHSGIRRIIMSREATLDDIECISKITNGSLEIEAFVHGAMCIAYSGRCLLSAVLTGRSGNKGECAQPCRWKYTIHETGYPDDYFPIEQDETGTYILNSKDLMMIDHIDDLISSGVSSFKIEGRMKSVYYVASVVHAYRKAIDGYCDMQQETAAALKKELEKSATRRFTTGFYYGNPKNEGQDILRRDVPREYTFIAKVLNSNENGYISIEQRNKFNLGDTVEILSPFIEKGRFVIEEIIDESGNNVESAPHAQQILKINCPYKLQDGDLLRRKDD